MLSDIKDQASGYLATFWNDNGNVAICPLLFASVAQGLEWAAVNLNGSFPAQTLKRSVAKAEVSVLDASAEAVAGWRLFPLLAVEADRKGASISPHHVESLR